MSQERATVDEYNDLLAEYNDLLAEVKRLRAIIGDQQILLGEHGMDNRHAYEEGGSSERAAVVAWLYRQHYDDTAERIERGEHRRGEQE
jgi:hypothetical protein